jgi:hypothetical protein
LILTGFVSKVGIRSSGEKTKVATALQQLEMASLIGKRKKPELLLSGE